MSQIISHVAMPNQVKEEAPKELWIPVGLVITMLGAAVSFGTIYSKVNDLSSSTAQLTQSLQQTREEVSSLRTRNEELIRALSDIKSDIAIIRASQIRTTGR